MGKELQNFLDAFYTCRRYIVTTITYISFRLYGLEVTWKQLWERKYGSDGHVNLNLDRADDLSLLLSEAKERLKEAESRLAIITDKCKNLLTLGSILLTLVTILITRGTSDSLATRIFFTISGVAFFNTIILLMVFFDVGIGMTVDIGQNDAGLNGSDQKKSLINRYLKCQADLNERTHHLVDVYKVARFFFLMAFTVLVSLFICNLFLVTPKSNAIAVAQQLETDTNFLQSVRGEKGEQGPKGDPGSKGEKGDRGYVVEKIFLISGSNGVVTNVEFNSGK